MAYTRRRKTGIATNTVHTEGVSVPSREVKDASEARLNRIAWTEHCHTRNARSTSGCAPVVVAFIGAPRDYADGRGMDER